jgi:hypothetical protein
METEQKQTGRGVAWGAGVLALIAVQAVCAQSQSANGSVQAGPLPPEVVPIQSVSQEKILREIDDLQNGNRWLLVRDDTHPGGPGRMVLVAAGSELEGAFRASTAEAEKAQMVVHAGDLLIVEEHTARVDAVLEARALASAVAGAVLDVRLTLGGKVVRAVAIGPGRAAFQDETGGRP